MVVDLKSQLSPADLGWGVKKRRRDVKKRKTSKLLADILRKGRKANDKFCCSRLRTLEFLQFLSLLDRTVGLPSKRSNALATRTSQLSGG